MSLYLEAFKNKEMVNSPLKFLYAGILGTTMWLKLSSENYRASLFIPSAFVVKDIGLVELELKA